MKRKSLVYVLCFSLIASIISLITVNPLYVNALSITVAVDGPTGVGVTDWTTYKAIDVTFNDDILWIPLYSNLSSEFTDHMTINGIPVADRIAKESYLNIGDCSGLYGNAISFSVLDTNKFRIFYAGGGTGDLLTSGVNTLVFDSEFPIGANHLGKEITVEMDPISDTWSQLDNISFWITDPNDDGVSTWVGYDYKAIDIHCSRTITSGVYGQSIGTGITDHITINGINLTDRINKLSSLNIGDCSDLNGQAATVNVLTYTSFRIYYCGGGIGDIDASLKNIVEFDDDFPIGLVTPEASIDVGMDPSTDSWSVLPKITFWVTDPLNDGISQWEGYDYKSIDIHCSREITTGVYGQSIGTAITDYVTINGVNLTDRVNKLGSLNIGDCSDLYGQAATVNVLTATSFRIYYCGGGTGDLIATQKNTVVFNTDFPIGYQTPYAAIDVAMEPITKQWSIHIPVGSTTLTDDIQSHIAADNTNYSIPETVDLLTSEDGWIRPEENVLAGFHSLYQPEVVYIEGEEYPYRMYFMGWAFNDLNDYQDLGGGAYYQGYPGGDAIFYARSKDLNNWAVYSKTNNGSGTVYWDTMEDTTDWVPVLTCEDDVYDNFHAGDPSVVYQDGKYYMAYSAMGLDYYNENETNEWDDTASCIMGAISTDGINWVKSDEPILIWEDELGMDERYCRSAENDTYFGGYQRPSLMYEDGTWKIWFDYWAGYNSGNGVSIGYAENDDDFLSGIWDVQTGDTTPLKNWFVDIDVIKIGDIYYAYGDPYLNPNGIYDNEIEIDSEEWSPRQIVEMQSYDGLDWEVTGYFRPDTDSPTNQIPQVFLDHKTGHVCLFYANQKGMEGSTYNWHWVTFRYMFKDIEDYNTD